MENTLVVVPRSKNLQKINVDTDPQTRVSDIVAGYAKANNINPNRLRLTKTDDDSATKKPRNIPLHLDKSLLENGISFENEKTFTVSAKDLGPQVSWTTVFMVEYLGPLVIHPLFYFGVYDPTNNSYVQKAAFIMVLLHFFKRETETLFVHRFSLATMPLFNIFKNSFHYWILSGVNLAATIYGKDHASKGGALSKFFFHVADLEERQIFIITAVWAFAECSNLYTHLILKNLRADGSKDHRIPYGYGFNLVSCPNYLFESIGWLCFALLTQNWSSWLFFVVSTGQMFLWAVKKHKRYLEEFGKEYPKNRKIFIPFIL